MALHDYRSACGYIAIDVFRTAAQGATSEPPMCPHCGDVMEWIPHISRMDAFGKGGGGFDVYDGQNNRVRVESYAQMHKIERESEQQARNGEGQAMRFRMLHQHRNNREVNTFGPDPSEKPTAEAAAKYGGADRALAGSESGAPDIAFGDGVNESNASALGK